MPTDVPTLSGSLAEANYLIGRIIAGCESLRALGEHDTLEDCWENAVEFGEWNPLNAVSEMPKAVICNATYQAVDQGEDAGNFIPAGQVAVLVYIKAFPDLETESDRTLSALSFFGDLVAEIYAQSGSLEIPGSQFTNRTVFINSIQLTGPTRTGKQDRGPDNENDYFDGVLFIEWGETR